MFASKVNTIQILIYHNVAAPGTAWFSSGFVTYSESTKVNPESYMGDIIKQMFSPTPPLFSPRPLDLEHWEYESRGPCHLCHHKAGTGQERKP